MRMKRPRHQGRGEYHNDLWRNSQGKILEYLDNRRSHLQRVSITQISRDTELNRRTVEKHINWLELQGMVDTKIMIETQYRKVGRVLNHKIRAVRYSDKTLKNMFSSYN